MHRSDWIDSLGHQGCCKVTRATEKGCRAVLPGREGHWLCLNGTLYQKHHNYDGKLCDLILFWHDTSGRKLISVVELKSGTLRPSEVTQQLQAGADIAMAMVKHVPGIHFAPVRQEIPSHPEQAVWLSHSGQRLGVDTLMAMAALRVRQSCEAFPAWPGLCWIWPQ